MFFLFFFFLLLPFLVYEVKFYGSKFINFTTCNEGIILYSYAKRNTISNCTFKDLSEFVGSSIFLNGTGCIMTVSNCEFENIVFRNNTGGGV
jgi:hypothetical protein